MVNNNWAIVKPTIDDMNPEQQALCREIMKNLCSEDGYERFMKQMEDDDGGFESYHVAVFGEPGTDKPFEWVLSGRHDTLRADGNSVEGAAFGGPIFYGHAADGHNNEDLCIWRAASRPSSQPGTYRELDVLADYAGLPARRSSTSPASGRSRIVVDAGNGMGGLTVPAVLGQAAGLPALPIEIIPLYFELDGTFPNHEANPLEPANLVDLQKAVVEHGADLGLAFDGDADRCFVVDETRRGRHARPRWPRSSRCARSPRARAADPDAEIVVIHNLITSNIVPETILAAGATPVRTRVGHSLIKDAMRETGAVFGGEHSAHYYFRDFWSADNGMLAAMHLLAEFGAQDGPLSALVRRLHPVRALRRDQLDRRRRARRLHAHRRGLHRARRVRRARRAHRHRLRRAATSRSGGSACARRTPSRCCASTSRRPTSPRWRASATRSSSSSAR